MRDMKKKDSDLELDWENIHISKPKPLKLYAVRLYGESITDKDFKKYCTKEEYALCEESINFRNRMAFYILVKKKENNK